MLSPIWPDLIAHPHAHANHYCRTFRRALPIAKGSGSPLLAQMAGLEPAHTSRRGALPTELHLRVPRLRIRPELSGPRILSNARFNAGKSSGLSQSWALLTGQIWTHPAGNGFPALSPCTLSALGLGADSRDRTCIVASNPALIAAALPTELCLHIAGAVRKDEKHRAPLWRRR